MIVVDKSYIIASIICVKDKFFSKSFVTSEEVDYVKNILLDKFNNRVVPSKVYFNDNVDYEYFTFYDGLFLLNKNVTVNNLVEILTNLPFELFVVLYNEEYMGRLLMQYERSVVTDKHSFIPVDLENIIDNIVDDSDCFYSKVADKLSKEEFNYICSLIKEKNCSNCDNVLCSSQSNNNICNNWRNNVLVGKTKVLRKIK